MSSFDIISLLRFEPPQFVCDHCSAIFNNARKLKLQKGDKTCCPICGYDLLQWKEWGGRYEIVFDNVIEHSRELARIATCDMLPLEKLYKALDQSKAFVHFVTWGISHQHIGALKLVAQRVKTKGIISGIKQSLAEELRESEKEAERLILRTFPLSANLSVDIPHTKLIVIDGLLAFKGSANLTLNGRRKAAQGREHIEVVTDIQQIKDLNNRLFSPIWFQTSPDTPLYLSDGELCWLSNLG